LEDKGLAAGPTVESARAPDSSLSALRRISAIPALLLVASGVAVLYDSYRYPLRINDASTSPTYRNTPLSLQAGKYAVLALLAVLLVGFALRDRRDLGRLRRSDALLLVLGSYALVRSGLAVLSTHSYSSLRVVLPFVCAIPFALVAAPWAAAKAGRSSRFIQAAAAFGGVVVVLDAAVNLVELALWRATGRLPALGYSHGLVRFGGIWDDPNGTAAFSALVTTAVLGGALHARRRTTSLVLVAALFNLVIAWSFSGWLLFLIGAIGVGIPRLGWRKVVVGLVGLAAAVAVVIGLAAVSGTNVGSAASTKLSSARQRLALDQHFAHAHSVGAWLIGAVRPARPEDAFGTWLSATGAVGVLLLLAWLVVALRPLAARGPLWIFVGALGLLVSSLFVPLFLVFPIGFFFVLVVGVGSCRPPAPAVETGLERTAAAQVSAPG
jgi:hypothetical protein